MSSIDAVHVSKLTDDLLWRQDSKLHFLNLADRGRRVGKLVTQHDGRVARAGGERTVGTRPTRLTKNTQGLETKGKSRSMIRLCPLDVNRNGAVLGRLGALFEGFLVATQAEDEESAET